jgi:hypothetical protein
MRFSSIVIIQQQQGQFGKIKIIDKASKRLLMINKEIEGSVFLQPNSQLFGAELPGPGAISASSYTYSFIVPAWHAPEGSGLIYGLGAAAGVVMLLALFPKLCLDVVDVDERLIAMTRHYFPLVADYEKQGRLAIINDDAMHYKVSEDYDFIITDIYQGDECFDLNLSLFISHCEKHKNVWSNLISTHSQNHLSRMQAQVQHDLGQEIIVFPVEKFDQNYSMNWLLTSQASFNADISEFVLFEQFSESAKKEVEMANQYFNKVLSNIPAGSWFSQES